MTNQPVSPQDTSPQDQPQFQQQPVPPRPVAYDPEGRPLYAHPPIETQQPVQPQAQPAFAPQIVHAVRPLEPIRQEMSAEVKARHDESVKEFPDLNLTDGEYVISAVKRHPIGLIIPLGAGTLIIALLISILITYDLLAESIGLTGAIASPVVMSIPILLLCLLVAAGMFAAWYVYTNNRFFLTNESVIQEIQTSLFSRHEQTVSLSNIEDASFLQENIIQHLFNYGSIRLSTEGDETTYRFSFVANPKEHIAILNNAVESFKLGRPVNDD